ncbi:MAG TPA: hypothetical protein VEZ72_18755 [Paenibacillus sp.]|nr:hypothetical protein [Paenibacillus sp.]
MDRELRALQERIKRLEERVEEMQYEPRGSRPFWLNFLFAFVVVLTAALAITGIALMFGG